MNATLELVRIMDMLTIKPKVLVNASAVGIYPTSTQAIYNEDFTDYATDFWALLFMIGNDMRNEQRR